MELAFFLVKLMAEICIVSLKVMQQLDNLCIFLLPFCGLHVSELLDFDDGSIADERYVATDYGLLNLRQEMVIQVLLQI